MFRADTLLSLVSFCGAKSSHFCLCLGKPEDTESASLQPPITDIAQTNTDPFIPTPDVTVSTPVLTVPTTSRTDTAVELTDGAELYGPPLPQGYTPGRRSYEVIFSLQHV